MLKALQEADKEPEPGNDELLSHYYALAFMLQTLNGGNIFTQERLID